MSLAGRVRVNLSYTRSTHLERDVADLTGSAKPYLPTARSIHTLHRIAGTLDVDEASRAWSLVGPYGSGKSSFAAFLAHLLGNPVGEAAPQAVDVLRRADAALADEIARSTRGTRGYCRVLLTGSPEPLGRRLAEAMYRGAAAFWQGRPGKKPAVLGELRNASGGDVPASALLELLLQLQRAVSKVGGAGVLIVVDELGKFLEYDARHAGANDIYLLQALAERAHKREDGVPLLLVALLHQSIDQYTRGIGRTLRNEWLKVQGRFETITFLDSPEQTLRIVAEAFSRDLPAAAERRVEEMVRLQAAALAEIRALPESVPVELARSLFGGCYPLHPVTALLLPLLCSKVAQNERTVFSYLGSPEPHGLRHTLERLDAGGSVRAWRLYDYFIANQPAVTSDSATHRRWAEVTAALDRLDEGTEAEHRLLKTIGLLNIVGAQGGFRASAALLEAAHDDAGDVRETLDALRSKSVIQFRRYAGEYRIWQGSDFDIEAALADIHSQVAALQLADTLNERRPLHPIVARRYSIEKGTLRHFRPVFADPHALPEPEGGGSPRIVLVLAESGEEARVASAAISGRARPGEIVGIVEHGGLIREAVLESLALERIRAERQDLQGDPVAQRELSDRLDAALSREEELVQSLTARPEVVRWFAGGEPLGVSGRADFQRRLSEVMASVYHLAPIVRNELINRDKPSSQAAAARNKLLFALLRRRDEEDLGFEKAPPERGIYRSLFKATGLHRRVRGKWALRPPPRDDPCNLRPVWRRLDAFLDDTAAGPRSFEELQEEFAAPPYGVKGGVRPLLFLAVYLANEHEVALFENRAYTPYLTEAHVERFLRRPGDFTVQRFRIEGLRSELFKAYSTVIHGGEVPEGSLLSVARPLLRFFNDLPEYTRSTADLSPAAKRVRDAFVLAKSPQRLLLEALPVACARAGDGRPSKATATAEFGARLKEALRELKYAHQSLMDGQRSLLCTMFQLPAGTPLDELRRLLPGRVRGLDEYTIDSDGLKAFIARLQSAEDEDTAWFNSLLVFLSRKSTEKWRDTDRVACELRLREYAQRMNDLRKLQVYDADRTFERESDFDVILLRAVRTGKSDRDEVAILDSARYAATAEAVESALSALGSLPGRELRVAALAQLVDKTLSARDDDTERQPGLDFEEEDAHDGG